jgi:hypothetical protein
MVGVGVGYHLEPDASFRRWMYAGAGTVLVPLLAVGIAAIVGGAPLLGVVAMFVGVVGGLLLARTGSVALRIDQDGILVRNRIRTYRYPTAAVGGFRLPERVGLELRPMMVVGEREIVVEAFEYAMPPAARAQEVFMANRALARCRVQGEGAGGR